MTFWYRSRSVDPNLWQTNPDLVLDPAFNTATNFFFLYCSFFCLLRFEVTFTSLFKDKSRKEVILRIKVFLLFLLDDRRIGIQSQMRSRMRGRFSIYCIRIRSREAQKLTDPDPQHWSKEQPVKIAENYQRTDRKKQCCGSMTFWCGSGSAESCLWLMNPDPDPLSGSCYFIDLQDASKKLIFQHNFFCLLLFEGTFTSFFIR